MVRSFGLTKAGFLISFNIVGAASGTRSFGLTKAGPSRISTVIKGNKGRLGSMISFYNHIKVVIAILLFSK